MSPIWNFFSAAAPPEASPYLKNVSLCFIKAQSREFNAKQTRKAQREKRVMGDES